MPDATFDLRRGRLADAVALAEFAARMYAETFSHATRPEDLAAHLAARFGAHRQAGELTSADVITVLAEADGRLAGYAQVRRQAPPDCVSGDAPLELWRFYVDRPWQGAGLARRLLDAVHEAARELGGRTLWLSVWEHNTRAIRFYERSGFRRAGTYPFWVGSDEQTDFIMVAAVAEEVENRG